MKKFLFSLTMLVAVALAGFTTSCSNNNDGGDDDKANAKVYSSSLNVQTGTPDEIQQGLGVDLGTITEDVKIEMNSSANTLNLSIKGINLGELADIPAPLQAPFDIELNNVPYTVAGGVYNINMNLPINEETLTTDVAININGNSAYLISFVGSINGSDLQLKIFVLGDEGLMYIPVNISVTGTENK